MDNFIVSARKYRPATFATVVGQSAITNTLKNAVRNQQIAQAFLFTGPRGVGKTTCARILAKTINCESIGPDGEACNTCTSCQSFNKSASFNIFELDAASNNTVDDIRNLVDQVRIPPQRGYKVYIVDEVHMLSQAAFNAFLKTLEEPPAYAKFILATTEKHKILPTILSRCQIFDFKRISIDDISSHLEYVAGSENISAEPEALHIIAQKADGGLRDALSMFDQLVSYAGHTLTYKQVIENLNVLDYEYYFRITDSILDYNISNALLLVNEILDNGFEGQHFITGLGQHLRNLLVSKDPSTLKILETSRSVKETYYKQSQRCPVKFLLDALTIINECDINYRTSNNKKLHLEISLLQLCNLSATYSNSTLPSGTIVPGERNTNTGTSTENSAAYRNTSSIKNDPPKADQVKTDVVKNDPPKAEQTGIGTPKNDPPKADEPIADLRLAHQVMEKRPEIVKSQVTDPSPAEERKPVQSSPAPTATTLSGLNLGNVLNNKNAHNSPVESEENLQQQTQESYGNKEFSMSELMRVWPGMIEAVSSELPVLKHTLECNEPILEGTTIHIIIGNKVQEEEIFRNKPEITTYLRKHLQSDSLTITWKMTDTQIQSKRPYTDHEKFEFIANKAPVIRLLKDQLGLDLEM